MLLRRVYNAVHAIFCFQCLFDPGSCMEKLAEVLIHIGDEKACLSVVNRLLKASPFHPRALFIKNTIEGKIKDDKVCSIHPIGLDLLEPHHCSLSFPKKRKLDKAEDTGRGPRKSQCQTINIDIEELSWSSVILSLCQVFRHMVEKDKSQNTSEPLSSVVSAGNNVISNFLTNTRVSFLINGVVSRLVDAQTQNTTSVARKDGNVNKDHAQQASSITCDEAVQSCPPPLALTFGLQDCKLSTRDCLEESQIEKGSSNETNDKAFSSMESVDGKVHAFRLREMVNDEEPQAGERRSTRLERLRTRRYDKIEDSDNALVKCWQIFKQLLEVYSLSGEEGTDRLQERSLEPLVNHEFEHAINCQNAAGCVIHAAKCCKNGDVAHALTNLDALKEDEVKEVARFLREYSCNSGIFHIGNSVLERVALGTFKQQHILPYLLELERFTRDWEKNRNFLCSLFLSEVYMDEAATSDRDSEIQQHLKDCDYHLCKLLEFQATEVFSSGIVAFQKFQDRTSEIKQDVSCMHWSFWLRFHYVSARFWMLSGNSRLGFEELQKCLSIFHAEEQADNPSVIVSLPHCKVDNKISAEKIERLLYEYNLEDLQRHSAVTMLEKGQCAELIDLLAPILLLDNDIINMKSSWVGGLTTTSYFSQELSGLEMLISACESVCPVNYRVAFQCYHRRLEIFCLLTGILASNVTDIVVLPELNLSLYDLERDQNKEKGAMKWVHMIWKELKVISRAAAHIKEKMEETGNLISSFMPAEFLGKVQHLLILVMGHHLSVLSNRRNSSSVSMGLEEDIESSCFVDAAVAFCRIQHLKTSVTVEQQVGLLVTVHELLAECGLCCAGPNCEGGEGAFLKMAIKHLLALEMSVKDASKPLNQQAFYCHNSDDRQEELFMQVPVMSTSQDDMPKELPRRDKPMGKTKRKNDPSKNIHEQPIRSSSSKNSSEYASSRSYTEAERLTSCVEHHQDTDIGKDKRLELRLENALDQNFFCLYGLNLRGGLESNNHDGLSMHKNTSRGDFQTKEQCAGVLQYVLPYAKVCSKSCLMKLRKVLRAVRKQFPKPPANILAGNPIDLFLDDEEFDEEKFCSLAVSASRTETLKYALQRLEETGHRVGNVQGNNLKYCNASDLAATASQQNAETFLNNGSLKNEKTFTDASPTTGVILNGNVCDDVEPYNEVYANLYYLLTQVEDMSTSDKWPGFVLTSEGEDFVEQNANLFKFDLLYNPLRFDSWKRLASIYDEEVDLMLNDGSKNVNVLEWRKNGKFTSRVENSRRRSRRCLLMSLALTSSEAEQSEMHEMLALVYYDTLQNVVPSYDQRRLVPARDSLWMSICKNSFRHFETAFSYKPDWTHLLYMGKLCEKMGRGFDDAFSFYKKAIEMNPTVVDPIYRLHCSRLKLLCRAGYQDCKVLQIVARYCFLPSSKDNVNSKLEDFSSYPSVQQSSLVEGSVGKACDLQSSMGSAKLKSSQRLEESWTLLFKDCMSAMHMCVEGELKHFHKARFSLAQGLKHRALDHDLEKAKEELSFCFKSSRSPFIINMWELDGVVKKSKRKTTNSTTGKRMLDLGLPESSRKFITCVRKYLLFYLVLCEQTKDLVTLERAYTSLKTDKKFSLCLDDVASIALGSYIRTLGRTISQVLTDGCMENSALKNLLEKMFNVFMDQGSSWSETVGLSLAEAEMTDSLRISEESIYGYIHTYLQYLEKESRIEILESVNERIRKRFRNPKLANSNSSLVCKHASLAWCRVLCFALSEITPLPSEKFLEANQNLSDVDQPVHFIIDLKQDKSESIYNTDFSQTRSEVWRNMDESGLATRSACASSLRELQFVPIVQVSVENMEKATALLRSSYIFYRESSSGPFPDGINLYLKTCNVAAGSCNEGVLNRFSSLGFPIGSEALDISTPRKLLLWAFALVHGRVCSVAEAVKYCEEQAKVIKQYLYS
ncbi:hypothetical protein O6H91_03G056900 [Diphasiastrum complanatum]|uniref:Uncharacterized protein n=1 Tax=Diphasiastrum complanatum TaxID=34168 RepID=A0ACC2E789_DIPCM|nr:hypothetical protein O6H91_03G056900 [Diphasiastrum complanatum]